MFSKIIEKILKRRILIHIINNNLLDNFQYGFLKNSTTSSATLDFVNFVSRALDGGNIVVAVFVGLKKAFDVVDYSLLLEKLENMGIRGKILSVIRSYLTGRVQFTKIE